MRVEPYTAGSIVHIIKRGARGAEIVRDTRDRERFLELLFFLNDTYKSDFWERDIANLAPFVRPDHWPERDALVDIIGWTLLDNHFHIIARIREDHEKGVGEFMQKICRSMTGHFNEKYCERGSIFQGPYKSKTVAEDDYLRYLIPYVMVKNTFEMFPDGLAAARTHFEDAWKWAACYRFSSFGSYVGETVSPIISAADVVYDLFPTERDFKTGSRDMLEAYFEKRENFKRLQLED